MNTKGINKPTVSPVKELKMSQKDVSLVFPWGNVFKALEYFVPGTVAGAKFSTQMCLLWFY